MIGPDPIDVAQVEAALGTDSWLAAALRGAARGGGGSLDSVLHRIDPPHTYADTQTTCRTHFVLCDVSGKPRVEELTRRLAAEVVDFCIPRGRIVEAARAYAERGTTLGFGRLQQEARELFTTLDKSGEGGELLLYVLLENVLGIPQVLCKMPLKTNSHMHVHGADGVHASARPEGGLALYWGESKLYGSPADAVRECLKSLSAFLLADADVRRRDVLLVRDHASLEDPDLNSALHAFFDEEDPQSARVEYRGACLVGFDLDEYPNARDGDASVQETVTAAIADWMAHIDKRVKISKLDSINIEIFCIPFPSVDSFRKDVRKALGI